MRTLFFAGTSKLTESHPHTSRIYSSGINPSPHSLALKTIPLIVAAGFHPGLAVSVDMDPGLALPFKRADALLQHRPRTSVARFHFTAIKHHRPSSLAAASH